MGAATAQINSTIKHIFVFIMSTTKRISKFVTNMNPQPYLLPS